MKSSLQRAALCIAPSAVAVAAGLSGCDNNPDQQAAITAALQSKVKTVVIIYAENRSFDGFFGNFPGANGVPASGIAPQLDRDEATALAQLPVTWGGVTAGGNPQTITQAQSGSLANAPFSIETGFTAASGVTLTTGDVTRDLYHRFFEEQMQINGGTNDLFAAWGDAGGLTLGHWDNSKSKLYALAQQYTLADNFFQAAFGGSFLNHQYLICGCAPTVSTTFATRATNPPSINTLGSPNSKSVPQLVLNSSTSSSALGSSATAPSLKTGNVAPQDYFGTGDGYRAINTMQPPYQPSGNFAVDATGNDLLYADPSKANTLEPQTQQTIGDQLTKAGIPWKWYSQAWNAATADGKQTSTGTHCVIYYQGKLSGDTCPSPATNGNPRGAPNFQAHHHPFNYYADLDPVTNAEARAGHLKDETDLLADAAAGTLPAVAFYKPEGNHNQHPGYANIDDGDTHIANIVSALKMSPQYANMVILVTYDENGGQWDHVAPPKADKLGPGTRIPAIIISPFAKAGFVDHTQYDTASFIRLIDRTFNVMPLPGIAARDAALQANSLPVMGDLTNALNLP